jgi:hypothetical protein
MSGSGEGTKSLLQRGNRRQDVSDATVIKKLGDAE